MMKKEKKPIKILDKSIIMPQEQSQSRQQPYRQSINQSSTIHNNKTNQTNNRMPSNVKGNKQEPPKSYLPPQAQNQSKQNKKQNIKVLENSDEESFHSCQSEQQQQSQNCRQLQQFKNQQQPISTRNIQKMKQDGKQTNQIHRNSQFQQLNEQQQQKQQQKIVEVNDSVFFQVHCAICNIKETRQNPLTELPMCNKTHKFHQNCLIKELIKLVDKPDTVSLLCPICKNVIPSKYLNFNSQFTFIKEQLIQKLQQTIITSQQSQLIPCPTYQCQYAFYFSSSLVPIHSCPQCQKNYCLLCQNMLPNQSSHVCLFQLPKFKYCLCNEKLVMRNGQEKCKQCGKNYN